MKLIAFDFEATDKDPLTARPLELCYAVYDTELKKIINLVSTLLWHESYPSEWPDAEAINGISPEEARREGACTLTVLTQFLATVVLEGPWLVAHNGKSYDMLLLQAEATRLGLRLPEGMLLIDTRYDLPYPARLTCRKLSHLALDHKLVFDVNTLHRAEADVELMLALLGEYPLDIVLKMASAEKIVVEAGVNYNTREDAKARGYRWETLGDRKFPKSWVKELRDYELEAEVAEAPFTVRVRA